MRPRPKAVSSVSSYVARPSIIHDIAKLFGNRNGARPSSVRPARHTPRASSRCTVWASSWLSTSRSQPSWLPKLSLPSGATARIVTSG